MDPLSLLCRLAAAVPPPRFNTIRYAGVLAANAKLRPRVVPKPAKPVPNTDSAPPKDEKKPRGRCRAWAELLKRTFSVDVLACDKCTAGSSYSPS